MLSLLRHDYSTGNFRQFYTLNFLITLKLYTVLMMSSVAMPTSNEELCGHKDSVCQNTSP